MNTLPVRCGFRRTMTSIAIHRLFLLIATVTAFTLLALAQDIQKLDPALEQLVGPDSKLERIATGFNNWTEGPVWTHEGTLLFAEIPANNIDLWIPGKGASVFMHPSGYTGAEPFKGPEPGSNAMIWCTNLMARCTSLILLTVCPPRRTTIRKRSCRSTVSIAFPEHGTRSLGQNRH